MSRLPRALAGRLDRLSRRAHAFHRWSHHPLCERYAGEVIRVGRRVRLCRGCTLAAAGGAAGLALGAALPAASPAAALALGLALLALSPLSVRARSPRAKPRSARAKLLTRLAPTLLAAALVGQALRAPVPLSLLAAALGLAAVALAVRAYRRRGPDRAACTGCPHGPPSATCPGFAPMMRRERAFGRVAGRLVREATRPVAGS